MPGSRLRLSGEAGLTLVEVVVALGILAVGVAALLSTFPLALSGVEAGHQSSTALFLAVQRLEEVKAFALSPEPARGFANLIAATFPDEAYATIAGYAAYRRRVSIVDAPAVAGTKMVQVTVSYRPMTDVGRAAGESAVSVSTLIASR